MKKYCVIILHYDEIVSAEVIPCRPFQVPDEAEVIPCPFQVPDEAVYVGSFEECAKWANGFNND